MVNSVIEANRAAVAAFGVPPDSESDGRDEETDERLEDRLTPAGEFPGWEVTMELAEDGLGVGDSIRFSKVLSEDDVERFAAASGDTNPLHLDEEFAATTRFDGRIVHGMLATGLISAALARLPGGVVYLSQDTEFLRPIRIGDRVTAVVEAVEDLGGGRYRLSTRVLDGDDEVAVDGEATVLIE
jgi:acyl dehydratase